VEHLLSFVVGDVEELPFHAGSFDVLLCECSFSLLNRKYAAAREFHRVLRSGGRIGIADFYLRGNGPLPASKLRLCPPGTETEEKYRTILLESGFHDIGFEDETQKLKEHFLDLLLAPDCAGSLLDQLPGLTERAAHFKSVGYCIMTATKG
jgi:ubiquinone/menaquinone biosynthesis C-methylase UbiE